MVSNGDRHLFEPDNGGECLILEVDDCACGLPNNGDVEPSKAEVGGEDMTLDADECTFCAPMNEDGDLSESEDDVLWLISDAAEGACDWAQTLESTE